MKDPLVTYIEDHMAGAAYAIDLLDAIRDQNKGQRLGEFAAGMLVEVQADNAILEKLGERVGAGSSGLKGLSAWVAEKVSRLKLKPGTAGSLGVFEALEFLALGIHGKLALWRTLGMVSKADVRLNDIDFDRLVARAKSQHDGMEEQRLEVARVVFQPLPERRANTSA